MKVIITKKIPLEFQEFPLYGGDSKPLGKITTLSAADVEKIHSGKVVEWNGKKVVFSEKPAAEALADEIAANKAFLASTDYKLLKFMDGDLDEKDYSETKQKRHEARETIKALENELKKLEDKK